MLSRTVTKVVIRELSTNDVPRSPRNLDDKYVTHRRSLEREYLNVKEDMFNFSIVSVSGVSEHLS